MTTTKTIQVGPGERRLLPNGGSSSGSYQLTCLRGQGALRIMSRSQILSLGNGAKLTIPATEIATVSARSPMILLITKLEERNHDS